MTTTTPKRPLTVARPELLRKGTDDQFRTMCHNLLTVAQVFQETRASHAAMLGLSGVQYTILTAIAYLQGEEGTPVNVVARHLHVSASFVTMEIVKMVKLGVVAKLPHPTDKRRVQLKVSKTGWKLLNSIVPIQQPVNDALFGNLSAADIDSFARIIDVLAENGEHAKALLELLKHSDAAKKIVKGQA